MDPMYQYQFRLILIGDSTVGKSSLLKYFTEGTSAQVNLCDATVGVDFYARLVQIKPNVRVKLQLWDTAGQEKFRSITRSYYRNSAGVVVVYDITQRHTFENVALWLQEAQANVAAPDPSMCVFMLVGHKADLMAKREVLYEEGEYFAKYHKIKFIETSAIDGSNVEEAFQTIARDIYTRIERGDLKVQDGWDGVKNGLMQRSHSSISLDSANQYNQSETGACAYC